MSTETITVTTWYGADKEMTREEYMREWLEHAHEFRKISWDYPHELLEIESIVRKMCNAEFDRLREKQG